MRTTATEPTIRGRVVPRAGPCSRSGTGGKRNASPGASFNSSGRVPRRCAGGAHGCRLGGIMTDVSSFRDVVGFDGDLQMFRETARAVNVEHLQFLRWLI